MVMLMVLCGICGGTLCAMAAGFGGAGFWIMALAYTGGGSLAALIACFGGMTLCAVRAEMSPPPPRAARPAQRT